MADDEDFKHCPHCDLDLPRSQFYKDSKSKDGKTVYCKDYYAAYYAQNQERQKATNYRNVIKRRYGLTVEEYRRALARGCAICRRKDGEVRVVMDHCHASGKVRDALCDDCNKGLGGFRDNPDLLRQAALYLESHG